MFTLLALSISLQKKTQSDEMTRSMEKRMINHYICRKYYVCIKSAKINLIEEKTNSEELTKSAKIN